MEGAQLLADRNIVEDRKFLGWRREVFGPLCVRTRLIRQSLTGDETRQLQARHKYARGDRSAYCGNL